MDGFSDPKSEPDSVMVTSSTSPHQAGWWNRSRAVVSAAYPRLLGALIVFKLLIPLLILGCLISGVWSIAINVGAEFDRLNASLQPKLERAKVEIARIRDEGRRLADKLAQIKNEGAQAVTEVKNSVEPIRQSLHAISSSVGALSGTVESIINAIIRVVKKIPVVRRMARNIHKLDLPSIKVPGFSLPDVDIDLNLNFDTAAVEAFQEVSTQMADDVEGTMVTLINIWSTFWWIFKTVFWLMLCWLLLTFIGMLARYWHRLKAGLQLILGHGSTASLKLL